MKKIIIILMVLFAVSICIGEVSSHRGLKYLGSATFNFGASDSDGVKYSSPIDLSGIGAIAEAAAGVGRTDSICVPIIVSAASINNNLTSDSVRTVTYLTTSQSDLNVPSTDYTWQVDSTLVQTLFASATTVETGRLNQLLYRYSVDAGASAMMMPKTAWIRMSLAKGDSCKIKVSIWALE